MFFSDQEVSDLIKAWLAISFAFAIVLSGGIGPKLFPTFLITSLTVGMAFIAHELAHKYVAQRLGCWAEFRAFDWGLILAVLMSLTGFLIAAPGAVLIGGMVSDAQNGKIAMSGPLANLLLASIFLTLSGLLRFLLTDFSLINTLLSQGAAINAWLAFFNLLPFWLLDGNKIIAWRVDLWLGLILTAGFLVFVI